MVGRIGLPAAAAQVLHRVQKQLHASDLRHLRAQPVDHGLTRITALAERLEIDKNKTAAGPPAAGKTHHGIDCRVAADDVHQLPQFDLQRLKRDRAVSAQPAVDLPGVLTRKEAFRCLDVQKHVEPDDR